MFDVIYRYDPANPPDRRSPQDADEACLRLEEGNRIFSSTGTSAVGGSRIIRIDLEDIGLARPGDVLKQQPFAAVLGCSDARAPIELIFDRTCNELFVVRVAGNVCPTATTSRLRRCSSSSPWRPTSGGRCARSSTRPRGS